MSFHVLIGGVFLAIALLTLVEILADLGQTGLRFVAPLAAAALGVFGQIFVGFQLGRPDSEAGGTLDWLHFFICGALTAGAIASIVGRRSTPSALTEAAVPLAILVSGMLFMAHGSTGTRELLLHLGIGGLLGLSGLAQLSAVLAAETGRTMQIFASLLMLFAGLLLTVHDLHG